MVNVDWKGKGSKVGRKRLETWHRRRGRAHNQKCATPCNRDSQMHGICRRHTPTRAHNQKCGTAVARANQKCAQKSCNVCAAPCKIETPKCAEYDAGGRGRAHNQKCAAPCNRDSQMRGICRRHAPTRAHNQKCGYAVACAQTKNGHKKARRRPRRAHTTKSAAPPPPRVTNVG